MSQQRGRVLGNCGIVTLFVSCTGLFSPSLVAAPQNAVNHQDRERQARKACLTGDYAKGIDILSDLFVDTKDPIFIFNQARCLEQNQRYEPAIGLFQEFLRLGRGKLEQSVRATTEQHIAECKTMLAQGLPQSQPTPQTPATRPSPPEQPVGPPKTPSRPSLAAQPSLPAASSGQGSGLRTAGVITGVVGGATLAVGVVLNLKANSALHDMESATDGYSAAKKSDYDSYRTSMWVGYGVGAALVVSGAVLYLTGANAKVTQSTDVAFVPMVGIDQVVVSIVGGL